MLAIIDYGAGNLLSVKNMLSYIGIESIITSNVEDIQKADKLILPGVGHFDFGMRQLEEAGLINALNNKVLFEKIPVLGICLGVQLLTEGSEEGHLKGLGWIKGRTIAFNKSKLSTQHKIPHMGWADVYGFEGSKLFKNMHADPRFYFVHSFHLQLDDKLDALVNAKYGYEYYAGIEHNNILGVQFHPEKSHKYGMRLLENFVKYY